MGSFSDEQLINQAYTLAGNALSDMTDWSDFRQWKKIISEVSLSSRVTYHTGILNQQVLNGGFIQYYDNGYGIFAYETLGSLQLLKADLTKELLQKSLAIINPGNYRGDHFDQYISSNEYHADWQTMAEKLDKLDSEYYQLEHKENLEQLLATFLRAQGELSI